MILGWVLVVKYNGKKLAFWKMKCCGQFLTSLFNVASNSYTRKPHCGNEFVCKPL